MRSACLPGQEWSEVQDRLAENTAQLWLGTKSVLLTEIVGDAIHVWLGAGRLSELMQMRPVIEQTGREWGCKRATIDGREGWRRVFEPYGYAMTNGMLEKTL